MMNIDTSRTPASLLPAIDRMFELSAAKIRSLESTWRPSDGAPVFTVAGRYQSRGWTEWTQGFQFGSAVLQFDATGEHEFLELARTTGFRLVERRGIFPTVPGLTRLIRRHPAKLASLHRVLTSLLPIPDWCFLNVLRFSRP